MATTVVFASLLLLCSSAFATPEKGQWSVTIALDQNSRYLAFPKHMYKDSKVSVSVLLLCPGEEEVHVEIEWNLRVSVCAMEFNGAEEQIDSLSDEQGKQAFSYPVWYNDPPYDEFEYIHNRTGPNFCHNGHAVVLLPDHSDQKPLIMKTIHLPKSNASSAQPEPPAAGYSVGAGNRAGQPAGNAVNQPAAGNISQTQTGSSSTNNAPAGDAAKGAQPPAGSGKQSDSGGQSRGASNAARKKRAADAGTTAAPLTTKRPPALPNPSSKNDHPVVAKTWVDGNYLFILRLTRNEQNPDLKAEVQVRMTWGDNNYLSALDFPLLIFYGVIGLVYIVMGLFWLVLLACNWRDLLRVQFWIGGVIFLGMLEKAVFFAEYENVNKVGVSVSGAVIFAELVSCLKRTLARMLVIIVSLGFGIVKPRLGQAFHKVLFVGALFFILAAIEGCMRATSSKVDQSNQFLLAAVPLAVLDAVICWWIFSSLVQTTRTLRLRRNVVKLTLYRHFTNTLIFAVLASIAYMIWFMTQHKFQECVKDWKQLWVDEAFWHMLFVVVLFIIMLLWRPTANNQRYAFSPLLDAAEEEEEDDAVMNDAFEGMKMRGVKAANGSPKQRDAKNKVVDDLKWVEEHIPSSVADKALPSLLDSDEELMTTKFEMSKME